MSPARSTSATTRSNAPLASPRFGGLSSRKRSPARALLRAVAIGWMTSWAIDELSCSMVGDTIDACQLHLQLAELPLAAGDVQGNGSLCSEVRDQFNLVLRKGLYAPPPNRKRSDQLVVSEHRHHEGCPKAPL